jgi:hypothetical protein
MRVVPPPDHLHGYPTTPATGRSSSTGPAPALVVKLIAVAVSGVTAFLHARARSNAGRAIFGALTGVRALAALFLGILLAG